jgi:hypothetical protein
MGGRASVSRLAPPFHAFQHSRCAPTSGRRGRGRRAEASTGSRLPATIAFLVRASRSRRALRRRGRRTEPSEPHDRLARISIAPARRTCFDVRTCPLDALGRRTCSARMQAGADASHDRPRCKRPRSAAALGQRADGPLASEAITLATSTVLAHPTAPGQMGSREWPSHAHPRQHEGRSRSAQVDSSACCQDHVRVHLVAPEPQWDGRRPEGAQPGRKLAPKRHRGVRYGLP